MNVLFIGIRENEQNITSGPKRVANTLFNLLRKHNDNIYFYGLPWENQGENTPDYQIVNENEVKGSLKNIGKYIKEKNIDVVYLARYYSILALLLCILKPIYRFKLVYTVHGIIKKEKEINKSFKSYSMIFEKMILNYSDKIVVITKASKEELLNNYPGLNEKKVNVINNGVSVAPVRKIIDIKEAYALNKEDKVVFTIGTRKIKNIETLICGFIGNRQIYKSCTLIIAGENDTEYSRYLIAKYKDYSKVKFIGNLNPDMLNNVYSQCDVYIQLSKFETFGMSIVEALLHKRNIVISSKLPISEYFSEDEVCFYNEEKDDLSSKILYCLNEKQQDNERGYQKAKKLFNWDNISEQYYKVFESAYYNK